MTDEKKPPKRKYERRDVLSNKPPEISLTSTQGENTTLCQVDINGKVKDFYICEKGISNGMLILWQRYGVLKRSIEIPMSSVLSISTTFIVTKDEPEQQILQSYDDEPPPQMVKSEGHFPDPKKAAADYARDAKPTGDVVLPGASLIDTSQLQPMASPSG